MDSIDDYERMVVFLQLPSNPAYAEVYSIQHYVIQLVSDLRQVNGFLRVHEITEILLREALNTLPYTTIKQNGEFKNYIVLSVLLFTASEYPLGFFKFFWHKTILLLIIPPSTK